MTDPSLWRPATALCAQIALLALLGVVVGLSPWGWVAATVYALAVTALLLVAIRHHGRRTLGPADLVTLARVALIGAATALVADGAHTATLVAVVAPALVLDWVDGLVARGTRTCSDFGARFDMEADAFLILVLSVQVALRLGPWVLVIGVMRYLFALASWLAPWLGRPLPPSTARKTVAAAQGVVLLVAASELLPETVTTATVTGALAALVWSFGRDVVGLWRTRPAPTGVTERS